MLIPLGEPIAGTPYYWTAISVDGKMESSFLSFNGSQLLLVFDRSDVSVSGTAIEVFDITSGYAVFHHSIPVTLGLGCVLKSGGTVSVFGVTSWMSTNSIQMIQSTDLMTWSDPVTVYTPTDGSVIFNTTVTQGPAGKFILCLETVNGDGPTFHEIFLESKDLLNWTPVGSPMNPGIYSACPYITFLDGFYYIFWLELSEGVFRTRVSRSSDFVSFELSPVVVLDPQLLTGDINSSDIDIMDLGSETLIAFAEGDQKTYTNIRVIAYPGSLARLIGQLFPIVYRTYFPQVSTWISRPTPLPP